MSSHYVRSILEGLLHMKGQLEGVAEALIKLARAEGSSSCRYCGIELSASPTTTVKDIQRHFSIECIRKKLMPVTGRQQLKLL